MQNNEENQLEAEEKILFEAGPSSVVPESDATIQSPIHAMDEKALRMMQRMGYKVGAGLGKQEQGIVTTLEVTTHLGKRGLGHAVENINASNESWDFSQEQIDVEEKVEWLDNANNTEISQNELEDWLKEGPTNTDIINHSYFCDQTVVENVFKAKNIFDELDPMELNKARSRANPFETVRSMFFMNRAALKMANIDAACNFMFTTVEENDNFNNGEGPIYFADICAGPGGFTEYILWRKQWWYKGFGMTLKDEHDFKVSDSTCVSSAMFQALYGVDERGDVCNPDNLTDFADRVINESSEGLHFIMSDGGFCVEGQESLQEILSKSIYACQCLLALNTLRPHGSFVTKTFDIFTPFSVGLLYLMYLCFEKVGIIKPNSSRPANSERYFVCHNFKVNSRTNIIRDYLWKVVIKLWKLRISDRDVLEIVDMEVLKQDSLFFRYIFDSSTRIGNKQIVALNKLAAFCRNPGLVEARQPILRTQCLEYWNLPDERRRPHEIYRTQDLLTELGLICQGLFFKLRYPFPITSAISRIKDPNDWQYTYTYSSEEKQRISFYAGVGFSNVYHLQGQRWNKVRYLELVKGTLLLGDFVKENVCLDGQQVTRYSLHVIDAVSLGSMHLLGQTFEERSKLIRVFCKAINRESQSNYSVRVRPKPIHKLSCLSSDISLTKNEDTETFSVNLPRIGYRSTSETYEVNSVLLINTKNGNSAHWVQSGMNEFNKSNIFVPCCFLDELKKKWPS